MSRKKQFTVVVHKAEEGGYWAEVPALPGCLTQGETLDEVMAAAKEAIASHIQALRKDGQNVPDEAALVFRKVEVAA